MGIDARQKASRNRTSRSFDATFVVASLVLAIALSLVLASSSLASADAPRQAVTIAREGDALVVRVNAGQAIDPRRVETRADGTAVRIRLRGVALSHEIHMPAVRPLQRVVLVRRGNDSIVRIDVSRDADGLARALRVERAAQGLVLRIPLPQRPERGAPAEPRTDVRNSRDAVAVAAPTDGDAREGETSGEAAPRGYTDAPDPAQVRAAAEELARAARPAPPTGVAAATAAPSARHGAPAGSAPSATVAGARAAATTQSPSTGGSLGRKAGALMLSFVAISLLGVIVWRARKKRAQTGLAIHVVASHRLGPKHTAVVLEAMGRRDLLVLTDAGATILRSEPAPSPTPVASPQPDVVASWGQVDAAPQTGPAAGRASGRGVAVSSSRGLFGQLLHDALAPTIATLGIRDSLPSVPTPEGESDAVRGILGLRRARRLEDAARSAPSFPSDSDAEPFV